MRTLIANGTVVTADGSYRGRRPRGRRDDRPARRRASRRAGVTADETIDASGKYVIPGAIDVHTHMELPFGGTFAKDTFETGTRAAAFGGTTTHRRLRGPVEGPGACARASTRGTRRPRATPSSTTGST